MYNFMSCNFRSCIFRSCIFSQPTATASAR